MKKNIAYVTGTRSDFGLITPLLKEIEQDSNFTLHLYATGLHLLPKYGDTIQRVKSIFPNVKIIRASLSQSDRSGMLLFGADLMKALTKEFTAHRPNFVIVHGDRIEALITAVTCRYLDIPIAHIHGGDKTTTVDNNARQAITNLASLHFPATIRGAHRIERMGVGKEHIHVVGALGLDALRQAHLKSRKELETIHGIPSRKKFILVVQHPVSEHVEDAGRQMTITLKAVKEFRLPVVVVYPNGDPGSKEMIACIRREEKNSNFYIFPSLDHATFASLAKEAAVWVGNSSAGIVESTYFKTPVVNVGPRQDGRERGLNIIDVRYNETAIKNAIQKCLFEKDYRRSLQTVKTLWGDGKAAKRIMKVLKNLKQ